MASAYSPQINFLQYEKPASWDVDFLTKALMYKQGEFDRKQAQTQAFINQYASNMDLVKPEDREYFMERLKGLVDTVNEVGTGDLSEPGVAEKLTSYISSAADKNVLNGYYSTLAYRDYEAEWEKIREESPELYSDANYQYGLQNFYNWISDGQTGTSVSSYKNNRIGAGVGDVNPFVNISEIANERLQEIEPNTYVTFDPTTSRFTFRKTTGEEITDTQIISALESTLSTDPRIAKQMEINAWSQYGHISDSDFGESVRTYYGDIVGQLDSERRRINGLLAASTNEADQESYRNALEVLDNAINEYKSLRGLSDAEIAQRRPQLETQMYKRGFYDDMTQSYAYSRVKDVSFETNQGALAEFREYNTQRRHEEKMKFDQSKRVSELIEIFDEDPSLGRTLAVREGLWNEIRPLVQSQTAAEGAELDTRLKADFAENQVNAQILQAQTNVDDGISKLMHEILPNIEDTDLYQPVLDENGNPIPGQRRYDPYFAEKLFNQFFNNPANKDNFERLTPQQRETYDAIMTNINMASSAIADRATIEERIQREAGDEFEEEYANLSKLSDIEAALTSEASFLGKNFNIFGKSVSFIKDGSGRLNIIHDGEVYDASNMDISDFKEFARNELYTPSSELRDDLYSQMYEERYGTMITQPKINVSSDDPYSMQVFSELNRLAPEESSLKNLTSVDAIKTAMEQQTEGDEDGMKLGGATITTNINGTVTVSAPGYEPYTLDISNLPETSEARSAFAEIQSNLMEKVSLANKENQIFEEMSKNNQPTERESRTIPIYDENERPSDYRIEYDIVYKRIPQSYGDERNVDIEANLVNKTTGAAVTINRSLLEELLFVTGNQQRAEYAIQNRDLIATSDLERALKRYTIDVLTPESVAEIFEDNQQ